MFKTEFAKNLYNEYLLKKQAVEPRINDVTSQYYLFAQQQILGIITKLDEIEVEYENISLQSAKAIELKERAKEEYEQYQEDYFQSEAVVNVQEARKADIQQAIIKNKKNRDGRVTNINQIEKNYDDVMENKIGTEVLEKQHALYKALYQANYDSASILHGLCSLTKNKSKYLSFVHTKINELDNIPAFLDNLVSVPAGHGIGTNQKSQAIQKSVVWGKTIYPASDSRVNLMMKVGVFPPPKSIIPSNVSNMGQLSENSFYHHAASKKG